MLLELDGSGLRAGNEIHGDGKGGRNGKVAERGRRKRRVGEEKER